MNTPMVKIYSSGNCSFCVWAKKLLDKKHISYEEIRIDLDDKQRQEMVEMTRMTSVPQIFIGSQHIGGYSDMVELDQQGQLNQLLGIEGA